ncbi:MAG TPA: isocitrate lyase/phosphoenolpyruvate mutase family protein [Mycobacteriales bacterium]
MVTSTSVSRAALLRSFHQGQVLVLPNAWDAGSAAVMAAAGARAIGTTSGGMSWSHGCPDGQQMSRADMVAAIARIVAAVEVPVTADIEGGYGPAPADVGATVEAVVAVGAAGVNLEDSLPTGGALFDTEAQSLRLAAARTAAADNGVPELVVNARTDVFLFGIGEPEGRLDEVLVRAGRYAQAGADCLFVPGVTDLDTVRSLVAASPLPVNVMAGPGGPSVTDLAAAGVQRISVGTAIAQAAYTLARRATRELVESGTYNSLDDAMDFVAMNSLFG